MSISLVSRVLYRDGLARTLRIAVLHVASTAALACFAIGCGGGGAPATYRVSGTVSGLKGTGLTLTDQSGASVVVTADGPYSFSTTLAAGAAYSVRVMTEPTGPRQVCTVSNATGTISASGVTDANVTCATALTSDNASQVIEIGNRSLEAMLELASFAGERLTYLNTHVPAPPVEPCADPSATNLGSATYTYADNDHDGTLSAGDTVTIDLVNCWSPSLQEYPTGSLTLTMTAPPQSAALTTAFAATAVFSGFQRHGFTVSGALDLTYGFGDRRTDVSMQVSSPPFTVASDGSWYLPLDTVSFTNASASKSADYVAAQLTSSFSAAFTSATLKAGFTIATPTPYTSYFDTFPTTGVETFSGEVGSIELVALSIPDNNQPQALFSASGEPYTPFGGGGAFGLSGFPWWEPRNGSTSNLGFDTRVLRLWGIYFVTAAPLADPVNLIAGTNVSPSTAFKLYFSAPVDPVRTTFRFSDGAGSHIVPASVTGEGAFVTVTPNPQLDHGAQYQLETPDYVYSTVLAASGDALRTNFNAIRFTTANDLQADGAPSPAVAAPGQTVNLTSTRSTSTDSAIVSYAWVQTSGTPVVLLNANTATASYVVPALALDGEGLTFQLTVADARGSTDSVPVTAFVLHDLTQPFLYTREQQGATYGRAPELAMLETGLTGTVTAGFQLANRFVFAWNSPTAGDQLQLQSAFGTTLAVGTYRSNDGSGILDLRWSFECNSPAQTVSVRESTAAPDGTLISFAADFSQTCPGGLPPLTGSVRVNSSVPLP